MTAPEPTTEPPSTLPPREIARRAREERAGFEDWSEVGGAAGCGDGDEWVGEDGMMLNGRVRLVGMPDGYSTRTLPFTAGKVYDLLGLDGSNVVITSDDPDLTVSVWRGRVAQVHRGNQRGTQWAG